MAQTPTDFKRRQANWAMRLRLLKMVFLRGDLRPRLGEIWRSHAIFNDVKANLQPFAFARNIFGDHLISEPPRFGDILTSPDSFTRPGLPKYYNSESSVSFFLGQLVFYKKAAVIVELGCFVGWTTAHLSIARKAMQHGHLYYLDYEPEHVAYARDNLKRLGLEAETTGLVGASLDPKVTCNIPEQIDVLFIDTSHLYPDTLDEILFYAPRMAPNGCIVLHDSLSFPGVRRAVSEVADKFQVMTFATEAGNGVTVLMAKAT